MTPERIEELATQVSKSTDDGSIVFYGFFVKAKQAIITAINETIEEAAETARPVDESLAAVILSSKIKETP